MADGLTLETTFLVDLEREAASEPAAAHAFLEAHPREHLHLTFTVAGELAAGPALGDRQRWESLLAPFTVLPWTEEAAWRYGRTFRHLRENGRLIGADDLWVAATALAFEMPVVTRNLDEYRRVPGLGVMSYGGGEAADS